MKGFSFRLEKVLNYRKSQERKAQMALFHARNEAIAARERIEGLREERIQVVRECGNWKSSGMEASVYHAYGAYVMKLDRDLETAAGDLMQAEETVELRIQTLKERSKARKIMETLKETQLRSYLDDLERAEQKTLDEWAVMGRRLST